ncbi:MAG: 50S ribosomal protein L31 [Chloroflexi bacterium]|nr:50S ribosomal protein L31 [Chloroflexota bacterium]
MKAKIHPKWYPAATVVCACGNTWTTGATIPEIRTDICSACHPFYTGEQRIVDTEGQIDRFLKKLQVRTNMAAEAEARAAIKAAPANPTLQDLGLDKRTINSLKEAGVEFANGCCISWSTKAKMPSLPSAGLAGSRSSRSRRRCALTATKCRAQRPSKFP